MPAARAYGVKGRTEINKLREAAKITADIYRSVRASIRPGTTEREIDVLISRKIKERGLKPSFKTIIATGPNAAKPHAEVTDRKIRKSDVVVLDFGVVFKGFCSDMTRTILIGSPDKRIKNIFKAVKKAQHRAIIKARAGLKIGDYVTEAHDTLRKQKFGKFILHTLGHGVGRKIHEFPKLSERSNYILKKNMVITIEPGLYIKGLGGVRIEDMILITETDCEVLTK